MLYFSSTAEGVAVLPMIESVQGVQNADEILATEGVRGAFVGPVDLRVSMGLEGGDGQEDVFLTALKTIATAGKKADKPVGIFTAGSKRTMTRNIKMGFEFILYDGDSTLPVKAAKASVEEGRAVIGRSRL